MKKCFITSGPGPFYYRQVRNFWGPQSVITLDRSDRYTSVYMVHTGKIVIYSRTFQGLLKDFPTVFKDLKLKKNTDLHIKILLRKC